MTGIGSECRIGCADVCTTCCDSDWIGLSFGESSIVLVVNLHFGVLLPVLCPDRQVVGDSDFVDEGAGVWGQTDFAEQVRIGMENVMAIVTQIGTGAQTWNGTAVGIEQGIGIGTCPVIGNGTGVSNWIGAGSAVWNGAGMVIANESERRIGIGMQNWTAIGIGIGTGIGAVSVNAAGHSGGCRIPPVPLPLEVPLLADRFVRDGPTFAPASLEPFVTH